jgi:leucyl aminopeptidase
MKISISETPDAGIIAYAAFKGEKKSASLVSAALAKAAKAGVFRGSPMEASFFNDNGQFLFIGLGKREDFTEDDIRKAAGIAVKWAKGRKLGSLCFVPNPDAGKPERQAALAAEGALLSDFTVSFKTDREDREQKELSFSVVCKKPAQKPFSEAVVAAEAQNYARKLANTPPNIATPEFMMAEARKLAKECRFSISVFDRAGLKKIGANGILAVNAGSPRQAYMIHLVYKGGKKRMALVGKGITFDAGGIEVKPSDAMLDMHLDKMGACVVLATMKAAYELKLPFELHGIIALTENMPDGAAFKPNEIISMGGKTVEIYHTDAEGRIVLGDCLYYASQKVKPDYIIDYATLTGAMSVSLGRQASGLFSNDDGLSDTLSKAGFETWERVWRMPMWKEYNDLVKGTIADLRNIETERRQGSSIGGAKFLEAFVGKGIKWAHIDIASTDVAKNHPYLNDYGTATGVRLTIAALKAMKGR